MYDIVCRNRFFQSQLFFGTRTNESTEIFKFAAIITLLTTFPDRSRQPVVSGPWMKRSLIWIKRHWLDRKTGRCWDPFRIWWRSPEPSMWCDIFWGVVRLFLKDFFVVKFLLSLQEGSPSNFDEKYICPYMGASITTQRCFSLCVCFLCWRPRGWTQVGGF